MKHKFYPLDSKQFRQLFKEYDDFRNQLDKMCEKFKKLFSIVVARGRNPAKNKIE